jgi:hypothetical protein
LRKGVGTAYEDGDADWLFLIAFQELAKTYDTCELVEEYIGAKVFPIRAGWPVAAWNDFASAIKVPEFTRSFGLTKNPTHFFSFLCFFLLLLAYYCCIFFILFYCCLFTHCFAAINIAEIEARANEILGPISSKEDVEIQEHLGGTRDTCLFFFFGIHAGDHSVTVARHEAQAKGATKKGGQGSPEAAAPAARVKVIKKWRGSGSGRNVSKRQRTTHVMTSEAMSSTLEESD